MQKWGKRPIYFKNAEIMQNALIMQTLRPLNLLSTIRTKLNAKTNLELKMKPIFWAWNTGVVLATWKFLYQFSSWQPCASHACRTFEYC